ncbi:hypothetical protein SISSUDRAFT_1053402 [Sistotremastrum suecicum HHB10207 ss-3]|uniref:Uncharacterized protein n=1 Tax=Sistotremastrum suecicum HHB10207 ss-3 TaxID=1314776 RepID=A0A165Z8Z3_9AGAM|nr:hypothetical protein SISSUDRAFT_1053402 [Sistotremastrum suecicum HHB10207 ss-3]
MKRIRVIVPLAPAKPMASPMEQPPHHKHPPSIRHNQGKVSDLRDQKKEATEDSEEPEFEDVNHGSDRKGNRKEEEERQEGKNGMPGSRALNVLVSPNRPIEMS